MKANDLIRDLFPLTPYAFLMLDDIKCEGIPLESLDVSAGTRRVLEGLERDWFEHTFLDHAEALEDGELLSRIADGEDEEDVNAAHALMEALRKALPPVCMLAQLDCDRDIRAVPAFCVPFMGPDADPDDLTAAADIALDRAGIEDARKWSRLDYYPDGGGMIRYAYVNGFRGDCALDDFEPTTKDLLACDIDNCVNLWNEMLESENEISGMILDNDLNTILDGKTPEEVYLTDLDHYAAWKPYAVYDREENAVYSMTVHELLRDVIDAHRLSCWGVEAE